MAIIEHLVEMGRAYLGIAGASVAAFIGTMARHVYAPGGFKWRRLFVDTPFVLFVSILAGGLGEFFELPEMVRYALAGSFGFLGGEWLRAYLMRRANGVSKGANSKP